MMPRKKQPSGKGMEDALEYARAQREAEPLVAHSKSEYKRLKAQAPDREVVPPPAAGVAKEETYESTESTEVLTAQRMNNFVVVEHKKHAYAFDMISDPFSVIMYTKNAKGQWVKAHGPYQSSVRNAVAKIREKLIRAKGAGKLVTELDQLIERLDQDIHKTLADELDRLRTAYKALAKAKGVPEAQADDPEPEPEPEPEPKPTPEEPQGLGGEENFFAKKKAQLEARPPRGRKKA